MSWMMMMMMLHALMSLSSPGLSIYSSITYTIMDTNGLAELPWLKDKPQYYHEMADAFMVLDNSCELPVHSAVLVMQSPVLCEAFAAHKEGQRKTGNLKPCRLRMEGCSMEEACSFVSSLYMMHKCSMEQARQLLFCLECMLLQGVLTSALVSTCWT